MTQTKAEKKAARQEAKRLAGEKRLAKQQKSILNRYFHHVDRGSTTAREIGAGLIACVLCVVCMFLNIQLISTYFITGRAAEADLAGKLANGEAIAQLYFVSMAVAFVGSLLMGLIARLPLVQIPSLGLASLLISALGIGQGLSYQNLMAVSLVSAAVYAVIAGVPVVRRAVFHAIPAGVRKAAPAAIGLLMVFVMLQMTGLVQLNNGLSTAALSDEKNTDTAAVMTIYGTGDSITEKRWVKAEGEDVQTQVETFDLFDFPAYHTKDGMKSDSYFPLLQTAMVSALIAVALYVLMRKHRHPFAWALLGGSIVFFVWMLCTNVLYIDKNGGLKYELDVLWGRLWMVGSEDAQHTHLPAILRSLSFGEVFATGFDFTAFTEAGGNVALLFATGILTFLGANLALCNAAGLEEETSGKAMLVNAGMNILSPLVGMVPVSITPLSESGKRDGAVSGLSSVVASLGFLLSAFVWLVPFLFATTTNYDIQFNMYGHYGEVLQYLTETSFIVADMVMALVGLVLIAKAVRQLDTQGSELVSFLTVLAVSFFTTNLAAGLAAGIIAHALTSALDRERSFTLGQGLAVIPAAALLVMTFCI